ncbi:hypothetical protein GCM10010254_03100 [Streptomyces chromofuscus]|nr:hypothetical protein GCM10010254_03100 [Streptomyces chromofuscus]
MSGPGDVVRRHRAPALCGRRRLGSLSEQTGQSARPGYDRPFRTWTFTTAGTDAEHLAPGVAAWLGRDLTPAAVRQALTSDLPPQPLVRPAAFLAHRLTAKLPPLPPYRAPNRHRPAVGVDPAQPVRVPWPDPLQRAGERLAVLVRAAQQGVPDRPLRLCRSSAIPMAEASQGVLSTDTAG